MSDWEAPGSGPAPEPSAHESSETPSDPFAAARHRLDQVGEDHRVNWQRRTPVEGFAGVRAKPMTLADILDVSIEIITRNWRPIGLVSLVSAVPLAAFTLLANAFSSGSQVSSVNGVFLSYFSSGQTGNWADSHSGSGATVTGLLSTVVAAFYMPVVAAVISRIAAASYLGTEVEPRAVVKRMTRHYPALCASGIVVVIAAYGGLVLCVIPGVIFSVLLSVVVPVIAVEDARAGVGLGRSWNLMKRRFWGYLGILIGSFLVQMFLGIVLFALVSLIAWVPSNYFGISVPFVAVSTLFSVVAVMIATPVPVVVHTLMYFDARVRVEGLDLRMMLAKLPERAP